MTKKHSGKVTTGKSPCPGRMTPLEAVASLAAGSFPVRSGRYASWRGSKSGDFWEQYSGGVIRRWFRVSLFRLPRFALYRLQTR
jgi:hypothetical protein